MAPKIPKRTSHIHALLHDMSIREEEQELPIRMTKFSKYDAIAWTLAAINMCAGIRSFTNCLIHAGGCLGISSEQRADVSPIAN